MINRSFVLFLLMLIFSGSVFAEGVDKWLNSKQIIELINGNTAEGHRDVPTIEYYGLTASVVFKTYFRPDGELIEAPEAFTGGRSELTLPIHGNWWSRKGWLCYIFRDSVRGAGQRMCWRVVPLETGTYGLYSKSGELRQTWDRVVDGDPYDLKNK